MNTAKYLSTFFVSLIIAWWSYHWLLGWSASLPIPDLIMNYYKEIGGPDPMVEYGIHFSTWYLPYALVALLVSTLAGKWSNPIPVLAAYVLVLLYLRNINYGFFHWFSQFLFVVALVGFSVFTHRRKRLHNKLSQQDAASGASA